MPIANTLELPPKSQRSTSTPTSKLVLQATALAILVFLIASASIVLTRFQGGAAFIWPATAPLLAFLAIRPPREWYIPVSLSGLAFWIASTVFGLGPVTGGVLTLAIIGEALIAATMLSRAHRDFTPLDSIPALGLFALAAGVIAPALSGVIASVAIAAHTNQAFWPNWWAWFAAHSLGTTTFTPLLLLFFEGEGRLWIRRTSSWRKVEATALLIVVAVSSSVVFYQETMPLLFFPLLPILLTTFRFGRLGAASSVILLALIGGVLTLKGHGPVSLMHVSAGGQAQFFQFYLAVAVLMVLPAAAELKRRNALTSRAMQSEASYRLLADNLGDTIIHTNLSGDIRFVSPAIRDLAGYAVSDFVDRNSRDFIVADDLAAVQAARSEAIGDGERTISLEYRIRGKNGDVIWCETKMRSYLNNEGFPAGVILVVRNASERKAADEKLSLEAMTDELTRLPNRRAFMRHLNVVRAEIASGSGNGCVALLDVDFFKRVNDVHGHATGDLVLKAIASVARNALRSGDMMARVGGEEFGIVLRDASVEQAEATCERVRAAVAACSIQSPDGLHILVTASLGLTPIENGSTIAEIYDKADRLLYQAKANGRNRVLVAV
jgi:diguanylate cyclase (GGDEF)-like protein/PAS domain S-box-containing protein